jgi:hypothetical protein
LIEALEFYADPKNWLSIQVGYGNKIVIKMSDHDYLPENNEGTVEYGGKRARQALEEIKES